MLYSSPAVDAVRTSLADRSDKWFHWLVVSSVIVGFGVAFEAWEATITLRRWFLVWRGRDVAPVNEKSLAIPASYLGLVLVIVGVMGEGVFEFLASRADTALRAHDEIVLAQAVTQAGTAKDSADTAAKAADEALGKANEVTQTADRARMSADAVAARASKLQFDLLRAGPRSWLLNGKKQKDFIAALKPFAGQKIEITYCSWEIPSAPFGTDREVTSLELLLYGLIQFSAKWEMQATTGSRLACGGSGVWVSTDPKAPEETNRAAEVLAEQLSKLGLAVNVVIHGPSTRFPPDTITLVISPHL